MADLVYPPVITAVKGFWKYLGLKLDFNGVENLPDRSHGGAIIAINHISYLDFALAGTAALPMKRYVRFMAKKEIFNNKLAGPLMRGMHHISVDRANGSASFRNCSIAKCIAVPSPLASFPLSDHFFSISSAVIP